MKITAIVGTYRKGGMIDQAVDEILTAWGKSWLPNRPSHNSIDSPSAGIITLPAKPHTS
jgi:hypothetical protein